MNRQSTDPFSPPAAPQGAASGYSQQPGRVPMDFREAMKKVSVKPAESSHSRMPDMAAEAPPGRQCAARRPANKWRSSFKPLGEQDADAEDESTSSPERPELYDPYDPGLSDSEHEMPLGQNHNQPPPDQGDDLRHQHLPPSGSLHWESEFRRPLERCEFIPDAVPAESPGVSAGHRPADLRTPDTEAHHPLGYGSMYRPPDHRVRSPDGLRQGCSTQRFPPSHGGHGTDGEDGPKIFREQARPETVRLSPPRTQRDFRHPVRYMETGRDKITSPTEVTGNRSKNMLDECPITCDLCDVEVANAQELEGHLESKTHWDTLEHIQLQNHYDDMAIAFLQEVMLYKSHQSSRAIDNSALQALEENDHMTKVEIFHCASCKVFVSTAAASVQAHITSQEHLSNTKEFEMHQRRDCLQKAKTIMRELEPQFKHFLKGGSPFQ